MSTAEKVDQTTTAESAESLPDGQGLPTWQEHEIRREIDRRRGILPPTSAPSIVSVRWGLTINTGDFSSARLDAEAVVPMGGSAESTLRELQEWVHSQSPLSERDYRDTLEHKRLLDQETRTAEGRLKQARARWERAEQLLQKFGLEIPRELADDLPF